MCDTPMFVMAAWVGIATAAIRPISPGRLIPISITAASVSSESSAIICGTPSWPFLLPPVRSTFPMGARAVAVSSFVVVFPTLPVTAIIGTAACCSLQ